MSIYKYVAKNAKGKTVRGRLKAVNINELQNKLKSNELYLESAREADRQSFKTKIKSDKLSAFAGNLGKLVGSGVPLVKALRVIAEDETISKREKEAYQKLIKDIKTGMSLSDAMSEQGDTFPVMLINMFKSAETAGNLGRTADQMSIYYDKEYRLNKKIKGALLYPKVLLVLMIAVVGVIMGYVIPQFNSLFARMGELPVTTRMLMGISSFVAKYWSVIMLMGFVLIAVYLMLRTVPVIKYHLDKLKLKMPIIGKRLKVIYTARFARTLSSLYNAGIPILTCINVAKGTVNNEYIERQFDIAIRDIKSGKSLSEAVDKIDGFNKKLAATIVVGEETGKLDEVLVSIADKLEYDSEAAMNSMVTLLEPCMIVFMAVLVGFILISVIQPLYGSYQALAEGAKR